MQFASALRAREWLRYVTKPEVTSRHGEGLRYLAYLLIIRRLGDQLSLDTAQSLRWQATSKGTVADPQSQKPPRAYIAG